MMKQLFRSKQNIIIMILIVLFLAQTGIGIAIINYKSQSGIIPETTVKTPATVRGKVMNDLGEMVMSNIIIEDSEGKRTLYTTNPLSGYEIRLPEGEYTFYYARGMQYSMESKTYKVENYKNYYLEDIRLIRLYDSEEKNFYPGDLHMHTYFSDGTHNVMDLINANIAAGLSWAVLSDHNDNRGISEWMQTDRMPYDKVNGQYKFFTPLAGVEITTGYGHFQSIGSSAVVEQWDINLDLGHNPYEQVEIILNEMRRNGAIVQLNHPYSTGGMGFNNYNGLWELAYLFDTIEIWNGYFEPCGYVGADFNQNRQSMLKWFELLNNGQMIFATGGTDLHSYQGTFNPALYKGASQEYQKLLKKTGQYAGMPTTFVYLPDGMSHNNVLAAVRQGNSFITNGVLIFADIEGATYGQTLASGTGEKVLNLEAFCRDGLSSYNIYKNGQIVSSGDLTSTSYLGTISLSGITSGDWIVIEVFGEGVYYGITNPIFFS